MRKRPMTPVQEARVRAASEAAREHERLGTDLTSRIDIFRILQREGIWLMFQPFRSLYGLYEREGDVPGILINSRHPQSLQRLTAAHEYGHHVLGHQSSVDDAEQILPGSAPAHSPEEAAAQAFSAHFLMPLGLVDFTLYRTGLPADPEDLTCLKIYQLSLELGVSYPAAVSQLHTLGKLSPAAAQRLRREQPRGIQAEIGGAWAPRTPGRTSGRWNLGIAAGSLPCA